MIYLASPYSSGLPSVVQERYLKTIQFTMMLLQQEVPVFSPIAYIHPFATAAKMPTDAETWMNFNIQFLRRADSIYVLRLMGWDQSAGVQAEVKLARALNIPRFDFNSDFQPVQ